MAAAAASSLSDNHRPAITDAIAVGIHKTAADAAASGMVVTDTVSVGIHKAAAIAAAGSLQGMIPSAVSKRRQGKAQRQSDG